MNKTTEEQLSEKYQSELLEAKSSVYSTAGIIIFFLFGMAAFIKILFFM